MQQFLRVKITVELALAEDGNITDVRTMSYGEIVFTGILSCLAFCKEVVEKAGKNSFRFILENTNENDR